MTDHSAPEQRRWETAALLFALVFPTLVTLVYFVWLAGAAASLQQGAYMVGKILQFGFPLVWVLVIRREPVKLVPPGKGDVALGFGSGFLLMLVAVGLYYAWLKPAGFFAATEIEVRAKLTGMGLESTSKYLLLAAFYSLFHSLMEEYYWRWFVYGRLRQLISPQSAVLISSVGFMAHHVIVLAVYFGWASPATWLFSLAVAVGGAGWAWLYQRNGSLIGVWGSHLLVDAAIFLIGYDLARDLFVS